MPVFLPTILKAMGHTSLTAQALSAPPYLFAFASVILTAYLSDTHRTRAIPIIFHSLLAASGYATIALLGYFESEHTLLRYLALYPAIAGFFSAIAIIMTWTINNQRSDSGKGAGMVVLHVIGQMGPLVGTSVFPDGDGPWFVRGMGICAVFMASVGVLAAVLRVVLRRENERGQRERVEYVAVPGEERLSAGRERTAFEYML